MRITSIDTQSPIAPLNEFTHSRVVEVLTTAALDIKRWSHADPFHDSFHETKRKPRFPVMN